MEGMEISQTFHGRLKAILDDYVHEVYALTRLFPRDELYGVISQLRRAALSVVLNYVEGYARGTWRSNKQFLLVSFASLKESHYLVEFSVREGYVTKQRAEKALRLADEIAAMLCGILKNLK